MRAEARKLVLLIVLAVIFVGVLLYRFGVFDERASGSSVAGARSSLARGTVSPGSVMAPKPKVAARAATRGRKSEFPSRAYRPLPLQALESRSPVDGTSARNIFVYYVPPPEPSEPEAPPVPPPLTISAVQPRTVYAGTGDVTITVSGEELPEEVQIFVNGRALPTTRVNPSQLSAVVDRSMMGTPGQLRVEVKDPTGELYSNVLTIAVEAPPKPTYKYIGHIEDTAYLVKGKERPIEAALGKIVGERWQVARINDEKLVLKDIKIGIEHILPIQDRAPSVASSRFSGSRRFQRRFIRPTRRRNQ
ncbi:MAG: hypothetical protein D6723_13260 [Acidobacteria bacterium]|nr:MAG: hypothetical protein D6723_13260 [Acidobacteriota bacterium]